MSHSIFWILSSLAIKSSELFSSGITNTSMSLCNFISVDIIPLLKNHTFYTFQNPCHAFELITNHLIPKFTFLAIAFVTRYLTSIIFTVLFKLQVAYFSRTSHSVTYSNINIIQHLFRKSSLIIAMHS